MFSLRSEHTVWDEPRHEAPDQLRQSFGVVGFNFRSTGLETRGRLCFTEDGLRAVYAALAEQGIREAVVLCTCNRTEVYFAAGSFEDVFAALVQHTELEREKLLKVSYRHAGEDAVKHLFRVCSGMDSAALGETEILSQVKEAFGIASAEWPAGSSLNFLFQRAMRVSKKVRTESGICREVTSIAGMAVRLAEERHGDLAGQKLLIIGAGHMADRIAKELSRKPARITVINRTFEKAARLAADNGFAALDWDCLDWAIAESDIVFCAIHAELPLIVEARMSRIASSKSPLLVDLCVPAAVELDPERRVVDMDEISRNCEANSQTRLDSLPVAESILQAECADFQRECLEREAAPLIKKLVEYAEEVRSRNLTWALSQARVASPAETKLLEDLSIRLVRGMLEAPISALKKELRDPVERAVVARLFMPQRESE